MMAPPASILCSLTLIVLSCLSRSYGAGKDEAGGTLGVYFENDMFAGTDQEYTNGIKLSWSSHDLGQIGDSPYAHPLLPLFKHLPYIHENAYQKNLIFVFGQNIYTPTDTETATLIENDRPYAGWLYIGTGVVWKDAVVRHSLILTVGVVGPWSLAKQTQRTVHDLRGSVHPKGWGNQIGNEIAFVLAYERIWRWPRHERRSGFDWEMLPHAGLALGTVSTFANAGAELRVGFNLPDDYGTSTIGPTASTSTPVDGLIGAHRSRFDLGFHVFLRADGRVVGRNIFLDGNTFRDSHSVETHLFVADLSAGAGINIKNTRFSYAFVYRSREFKKQDHGQIFGTASLNWTF